MSAEKNESALAKAIGAWNAGDLDSYLELYDESIMLHGYGPEPMGKEAARGFYEGIFAAFPNSQLDFHAQFSRGDQVAIRYTMTATHQGECMGVAATGKDIAIPGITHLRFANGKCVERWACADMLGLMMQLGAIPAPA